MEHPLPVKLLRTARHQDQRGWVMETYKLGQGPTATLDVVFVQDNHSMSRDAGVIRGLHWQVPPFAQAKLVRCVRGAIWDVAVDIRQASPTYGKWVAATLSADNGDQLFIPMGFAHGFLTLEPGSEVVYKMSGLYAPQAEAGLIWDDPEAAISWPLDGTDPMLSPKDRALPPLAQIASSFAYDGRPLEPIGS